MLANMDHAAKHDFVMHSMKAGRPVNVFSVDFEGHVTCTTVRPNTGYTITLYGIVKFTDSHRDANWIRWSNVYHIAGYQAHCIDWPRVPRSLINSGSLSDLCEEYKRRAPGAAWFGVVSVGPSPHFDASARKRVNSRLPPKWRVIQGGAR